MRTNIEETSWAKFVKIANAIGIRPTIVAGLFASLWHESQEQMRDTGTFQELCYWMGSLAEDEPTKLVELAVLAGFLKEQDDGAYVIVGNAKHIAAYQKIVAGSAKGVEARRRRQLDSNALPEEDSTQGSTPRLTQGQPPVQPNTIQFNSNQKPEDSSAVLGTARKKRGRPEPVEYQNLEQLKSAFTTDPEKLELWRKLYPDEEFRKRELLKAWDWYRTNERKRPTTLGGWKRAIGAWLEKGWPNHIARIPGKPTMNRFGKYEPTPVRYPSGEQVAAEQEASRQRLAEEAANDPPPDPARVQAMLQKLTGKLAMPTSGSDKK